MFVKIYKTPWDVNAFRFAVFIYCAYCIWLAQYSVEHGPMVWVVRSDGEFVSEKNMSKFHKRIYETICKIQFGYEPMYALLIFATTVSLFISGFMSFGELSIPFLILKILEMILSVSDGIAAVITVVAAAGWNESLYPIATLCLYQTFEVLFTYLTMRYYEEVKKMNYD